jgi:pilus assembly protein CpaE
MGRLIEELTSIWEGYIVINTTSSLNRWTVEVLDVVDTAIVVTTPELPAIRATRNFLDLADAKAESNGKWRLVMTTYQSKKMVRTTDIEATTHFPITATIAEDISLVTTSINRGLPLIMSHRKSAIAKDIFALAKQLAVLPSKSVKPKSADKTTSKNNQKSPGRRFSFWQAFVNAVLG